MLSQLIEYGLYGDEFSLVEWQINAALLFYANVRQSHAIGGQHASHRMQPDLFYVEHFGDFACMLAACAAETAQDEVAYIVATLYGDFSNCVGHALDGDRHESCGDFFRRHNHISICGYASRQIVELRCNGICIQRLVGGRAKDAREMFHWYASEQHIRICDRQWSATPVANRPRRSTG